MPYIRPEARKPLDLLIDALIAELRKHGFNPGFLNYCFSRVVKAAFDAHPSYGLIVLLCGMLINVKDEFYRRFAVPYEDQKIKENGDII